ncbi:MAG: T9SS type A sorting domain-containing protein, partial [Chitinophagales bacterium]
GFYEDGISPSLGLNSSVCEEGLNTPEISDEKGIKHPGSTFLLLDLDGDLDKEVILGDIAFENLVMGINGGTPTEALITDQDIAFPSYTNPALVFTFPAAFSADVNNDGLQDLLVTPNAFAQSKHYENVWYYENVSTTDQVEFEYRQNDLFVAQSIDVSDLAHPAFFDHNNDGLLDLVIGNDAYKLDVNDEFAALALYENVGTATSPAFNLVTNDYATVSQQFVLPRFALRPTFGDLDGDGDEDMLLGDKDGYLHYFKNNPDAEGTAQFSLFQEQFQGIDIKQNVTPHLYDVNGDELLDFVAGFHNGLLVYAQNTGTASNPLFSDLSTSPPFFGNVDIRVYSENPFTTGNSYSVPYLFKWNGELRLAVGALDGTIAIFRDIENNLNPGDDFELVDAPVIPRDGLGYASPAFADLDNDGYLDMLVGTNRGGLLWYEQSQVTSMEETPITNPTTLDIHITPNPSQDLLNIVVNAISPNTSSTVEIFNTLRQKLFQNTLSPSSNTHQIQVTTTNWQSGVYLIRVQHGQEVMVEKVLVQ